MDSSVKTVSYTHLDVYKRQLYLYEGQHYHVLHQTGVVQKRVSEAVSQSVITKRRDTELFVVCVFIGLV